MAGGLRLSFECIRDDEEAEMGLGRCATLHGFMMRVHMRVIVYIESSWPESFGNLFTINQPMPGMGERTKEIATLARTASSIGV